jgi:hypothetical protein
MLWHTCHAKYNLTHSLTLVGFPGTRQNHAPGSVQFSISHLSFQKKAFHIYSNNTSEKKADHFYWLKTAVSMALSTNTFCSKDPRFFRFFLREEIWLQFYYYHDPVSQLSSDPWQGFCPSQSRPLSLICIKHHITG